MQSPKHMSIFCTRNLTRKLELRFFFTSEMGEKKFNISSHKQFHCIERNFFPHAYIGENKRLISCFSTSRKKYIYFINFPRICSLFVENLRLDLKVQVVIRDVQE